MLVTFPGPPPRAAAAAIWIDGQPMAGGLGMRLRLAASALLGRGNAAIVGAVQPAPHAAAAGSGADGPVGRLRDFLVAHPELTRAAARLSATPDAPR
jgi:hypothetical protein